MPRVQKKRRKGEKWTMNIWTNWRKATRSLGLRPSFFLAFFLVLSQFLFPCYSEDAPRQESEPSLETLGSQIHTSLERLKLRSENLTKELERRELKVKELQTTLSGLSASLSNTNARLYDYETKLIAYEQRLKTQKKLLSIGAALVVLFFAVRTVTLILKAKGINLPEIVNILL